MKSRPTPRVLIAYQHLPHYRWGVFSSLEKVECIEYQFAADDRSRDGSIPTISGSELNSFFGLHNSWIGPFLWQKGLVALVWRQKFDAVVFLGDLAYLSTWVAASILRLNRTPVLFWTIGWHRPERGLRRLVRLAFYRLADRLLLYGRTGQQLGEQHGYPAGRMTVVGNSQQSHLSGRLEQGEAAFRAFTDCLPPESEEVVTAVVRLNRAKRLDLLVQAVAILGHRGRRVHLVLVGEGPERTTLVEAAAREGVALSLPGPAFSKEKLQAVYAVSDVTVVPVNAGLTSIQSMSYGCPVITNDDMYNQAPESESILEGVTGGRYKAGSVADLADKIEEWLNVVRSRRSEVAASCRAEIERRWSPEAHAQAINAAVVGVLREEP